MPKVLETLTGMFSRNRSQLESDAVPIPDGDAEVSSGNRSISQNLDSSSFPNNLGIIEPNGNNSTSSVELYEPGTNPTTNNILAVNNTQGQVVYQFSHMNDFVLGSVYYINTEKGSKSEEKQKKQITKSVAAMMRSNEKISLKMFDCISTHLGEGWQFVMRDLNFSQGQIHQATVDYQIDGGLKEVIYQLLLDWSRNEKNATLGRITKLLWSSRHFETVDYMKKVWKAEESKKESQHTV